MIVDPWAAGPMVLYSIAMMSTPAMTTVTTQPFQHALWQDTTRHTASTRMTARWICAVRIPALWEQSLLTVPRDANAGCQGKWCLVVVQRQRAVVEFVAAAETHAPAASPKGRRRPISPCVFFESNCVQGTGVQQQDPNGRYALQPQQ